MNKFRAKGLFYKIDFFIAAERALLGWRFDSIFSIRTLLLPGFATKTQICRIGVLKLAQAGDVWCNTLLYAA